MWVDDWVDLLADASVVAKVDQWESEMADLLDVWKAA